MAHASKPTPSTALVVYQPPVRPVDFAEAQMKEMHDLFLEKSFKAQIADHHNFQRLWNGNVVVLVGGSSAGKSTIIQGLKELDKDMVEEGSDLTGANFIYEFMQNNHEQYGVSKADWKHLHSVLVPRKDHWHIHEAVGKEIGSTADAFDFIPGTSIVDQERAIKTVAALHGPVCECAERTGKMIDRIVMDKILEHARNGKNAAFDLIDIDQVAAHPISQQTKITSVFVYCPFGKLTERLAERNRKAFSGEIDLSEVRAGVFPLLQYSELVRPRQASDKDGDVIDQVTKQTVEDDFDINFNAGIEAMRRTPEGRADLERMEQEPGGLAAKQAREKQILLSAFGFKESDPSHQRIELVARKKYDLKIDTSDPRLGATPVERGNTAALRILRH